MGEKQKLLTKKQLRKINKGLLGGQAYDCIKILAHMLGRRTKIFGTQAKFLDFMFCTKTRDIERFIAIRPFEIKGAYWPDDCRGRRKEGTIKKVRRGTEILVRWDSTLKLIDVQFISGKGSQSHVTSLEPGSIKHLITFGYIAPMLTKNEVYRNIRTPQFGFKIHRIKNVNGRRYLMNASIYDLVEKKRIERRPDFELELKELPNLRELHLEWIDEV